MTKHFRKFAFLGRNDSKLGISAINKMFAEIVLKLETPIHRNSTFKGILSLPLS